MIKFKMRSTVVDVASNTPSIQVNFGEQLTSVDEIVHLIATEEEEEMPIEFDKRSDLVINIGMV